MKPARGKFFRVETISGDYSHGLKVFAEWPCGLSQKQSEAAQKKVAKLLTALEAESMKCKP